MITNEYFENFISSIRSKIPDESFAIISDDILDLKTNISSSVDEYANSLTSIENLKQEKEDLLKVNGKLFQKIGYEKNDNNDNNDNSSDDNDEPIDVEKIIDEKGEFIYE